MKKGLCVFALRDVNGSTLDSRTPITFISVFADARVRIGLLQPHVDVVHVRHGQVEGGSGRGAARDYGEDEDEAEDPINGRKERHY